MSAEGAGLNSHGRKAVVNPRLKETEARRAGIAIRVMIENAAPSALRTHFLCVTHGLTAVAIQCRAFGALSLRP